MSYEIPLLAMRVAASILLLIAMWNIFTFHITPRFCAPFAFLFNVSGIIFLVLGFKYEINEMVKGGGMILFVSYLFTVSFLIDNFSKKKEEKDEK